MKIIQFNEKEHWNMIEEWCIQWHISPSLLKERLSDTGLLISNIACMFIYETNSPICFFENLISNREISSSKRDKAIKLLVSTGKEYAISRGYKEIILTTNNLSVLDRALEDGCEVSDEKFFVVSCKLDYKKEVI